MFINPKIAVDEGWITGIRDPDKQIQPNAIDFTVDKLTRVGNEIIAIGEKSKNFRSANVVAEEDLYWTLHQGSCYDAVSDMYVKIPSGIAAYLIMRSTFTRNGLFIHSGLYDSGFEGHIGCVIHNPTGITRLGIGTRLGQIIFVESDSAKLYAGGFNHAQDTHWKGGY